MLGRLGLSGGTVGTIPNSYSLIDLFSYRAAGTRVLTNGGGAGQQGSFSIDNGTTLLKLYNDAFSNGLDTRDWAPGTNDSFNQFSGIGVTNPVSNVDLREMDVIGYDRVSPLTITALNATPNILWPPDHKLVAVTVTGTTTGGSGAVSCKIVNVASNEAIDDLGDGHTARDWEITGNFTANLRAERSATGTGRIYTITVRCTDASGNSATKTVTVTVPLNQGG